VHQIHTAKAEATATTAAAPTVLSIREWIGPASSRRAFPVDAQERSVDNREIDQQSFELHFQGTPGGTLHYEHARNGGCGGCGDGDNGDDGCKGDGGGKGDGGAGSWFSPHQQEPCQHAHEDEKRHQQRPQLEEDEKHRIPIRRLSRKERDLLGNGRLCRILRRNPALHHRQPVSHPFWNRHEVLFNCLGADDLKSVHALLRDVALDKVAVLVALTMQYLQDDKTIARCHSGCPLSDDDSTTDHDDDDED
jgi:hypothetical protein